MIRDSLCDMRIWCPSVKPSLCTSYLHVAFTVVCHLNDTKQLLWCDIIRAALRLVQARVLCQMRAPYRPITRLSLQPIAGPQNCGPGCCSTPLNAALVRKPGYVYELTLYRGDYCQCTHCRRLGKKNYCSTAKFCASQQQASRRRSPSPRYIYQ